MAAKSTVGTLYQRMLDGIKTSEENRTLASERADLVRERALDAMRSRPERIIHLTEHDAKVQADATADADRVVQAYVGGEQWGHRLTSMYGIAHIAYMMSKTYMKLIKIHSAQNTTNRLLQEILVELRRSR